MSFFVYIVVCPVTMDTVFLLDGSTSIGQSDFDKMKEFIISVLEHFRISEEGIVLFVLDLRSQTRANNCLTLV